jgi:hypothetical protein
MSAGFRSKKGGERMGDCDSERERTVRMKPA